MRGIYDLRNGIIIFAIWTLFLLGFGCYVEAGTIDFLKYLVVWGAVSIIIFAFIKDDGG